MKAFVNYIYFPKAKNTAVEIRTLDRPCDISLLHVSPIPGLVGVLYCLLVIRLSLGSKESCVLLRYVYSMYVVVMYRI